MSAEPVAGGEQQPPARPLGTVLLEETRSVGVLLGLGLRRWSQVTAVTVSCLAFGLWHLLPARRVTTFKTVIAGLARRSGGLGLRRRRRHGRHCRGRAGLVLCWLRLRSRSLLAPALLHAAVNGLGYALACLAGRAR